MRMWTILTTEPQGEPRAYRWLTYRGVSCYFPQYRIKVRHGRSATREAVKPVFPGYLFTCPQAPDADVWRDTPGINGRLMVGDKVARLNDQGIERIREIEDLLRSDRDLRKVWSFRPGDRVRTTMDAGCWAGYEGIIQRLDDAGKTIVEIISPSRAVPVQMSAAWLEAV